MKMSRLRGAALAWGAILASGTAFAQYPYPVSNYPNGINQQYSTPPVGYPSPVGYPQTMARPMHLPPVTGNFTGPGGYLTQTPVTYPAPSAPMPTMGLATPFGGPVHFSQASHHAYPVANSGNNYTSVLATPSMQQGQVGSGAQQLPVPSAPNTTLFSPGTVGQPEQVYGQPAYGNWGYGNNGMSGSAGYGYGNGGQSINGSCANGSCGEFDCGMPCYRAPSWYVGAYGLWLTMDNRDHYTFSYDDADESVQFTDARDTSMDWDGGVAIVAGHYFNCGANALEFVYWGWYPDDVNIYTYTQQAVGNLNGIHNWDSLNYGGVNAQLFVDNALVHSLQRSTEVNNFEVNLLTLGSGGANACTYSPFQFSFIAGFRYFELEDQLVFGADTTDNTFDGDATEIFYDIQTQNHLYGFQIGGLGTYCATPRFSLNGGTKFGLFVNDMSLYSTIGGPSGTATINNGPFIGREWIVRADKEDLSFLGEVFLGGSYCLTPHWSLSGGYRAIAITGLAMPTDQIYSDLRGINDVESIESNSSAILHGAYFGAQLCF